MCFKAPEMFETACLKNLRSVEPAEKAVTRSELDGFKEKNMNFLFSEEVSFDDSGECAVQIDGQSVMIFTKAESESEEKIMKPACGACFLCL